MLKDQLGPAAQLAHKVRLALPAHSVRKVHKALKGPKDQQVQLVRQDLPAHRAHKVTLHQQLLQSFVT